MTRKEYLQDSRRRDIHRVTVEEALGRPLPLGAEIHHVDGDKHNNAPGNLVLCPSHLYHMLLHRRQRAQDLGYNLETHGYCYACKTAKAKEAFHKNKASPEGITNICKICGNDRANGRNKRRRALREVREVVAEAR